MTSGHHKKQVLLSALLFSLLLLLNTPVSLASWSSQGPSGGYITKLSISQANPDTVFAGTYYGGLFRSQDGGNTWAKRGTFQPNVLTIQVAPDDPDIVYLGTTNGMYKSEDGGINWVSRPPAGRVYSIAIDTLDPQIIYFGVARPDLSGVFGVLYKSTNGGETAVEKILGQGDEGVYAVLIDSDDSSNVYLGLRSAENSNVNFAKSEDGGDSWEFDVVGPEYRNDVVELAMTPAGSSPAAVYAIVEGDDVYRSDNQGENWIPTNTPSISGGCSIAVDPNNTETVYVGTSSDARIYKTIDAGDNWSEYSGSIPGGDPASVVIDPRDGDLLVGIYGGGIYGSTDGAQTFSLSSHGLNATLITDIHVDPSSSSTLFATVGGRGHQLAKSNDRGISWGYLTNSPTYLSTVAIAPDNASNILVGQSAAPGGFHRSLDGGETWAKLRSLLAVADIWIDPLDSSLAVIAASAGIQSCDPVCDEYTWGVYWTAAYGGWWEKRLELKSTTLAEDPNDPTTIYAGTKEYGYVYKSSNSGHDWSLFGPEGTWVNEVTNIVVDSNSHVYAATDDGLMKLEGAGISRKLTGLPSDDIEALAVDNSVFPSIVYAGFWGYGVYASGDGGSSWTSINDDLGNLFITALAISEPGEKMLHAGTAYGGVWSTPVPEPTQTVLVVSGIVVLASLPRARRSAGRCT